MAWDTERTKHLLLEAAVEEFAEHGFAGARVNRIASRAAINKERLYEYFGNKAQLFEVVLQHELADVAAAVPLEPDSAGKLDLGAYAGGVFDYHRERPHLLKLLHWEGLEPAGDNTNNAERSSMYADKVDAVRQGQAAGSVRSDIDAGALLYAVLALAAWRFAVPQATRLMLGSAGDDCARERTDLVTLARSISAP